MPKCAICGKAVTTGQVVHAECLPRWIPVEKRLPEDGPKDGEAVRCIVCLVDMVDGYMGSDGELIRIVTEANYLTKQKLWVFAPEAFDGFTHDPVNAMVGKSAFIAEDGEWIDTGSFVTHWMPLPEPPEVE